MTGTMSSPSIEVPRDQEYEIDLSYMDTDTLKGISTTVTGHFSDNEWEGIGEEPGIYGKIETALNDAFNAGPTTPPPAAAQYKQSFRNVFGALGFNIEVVIPPEGAGWSKWKADEDDLVARTLFLSFDGLDNGLQQSITDVVIRIAGGGFGMAKATPANNGHA